MMKSTRTLSMVTMGALLIAALTGCSDDADCPTCPDPSVEITSYERANVIHPTSTNLGNWNAQSFEVPFRARVDSVGVNVLEVVNDPGDLVVVIYSDSDGIPGALIYRCDPVAQTTGWRYGIPSSNVVLETGEIYWLVASSTSMDGSLELEHDNEGTYPHGLNLYSYDAGATWTPRPTGNTDLIFRIVGRVRD